MFSKYKHMIGALPTEKFTIATYLEPEKVKDKLLTFVEPYQSIRFNLPFTSPEKAYEGRVENSFFEIRRISVNRKKINLPIVEGRVYLRGRGSIIEVTIRPDTLFKYVGLLINFVFMPITVIGSLFLLMSEDINTRDTAKHTLYLPVFILIAEFIERETFKSDIRKDKQFLLEIFD
ncbi:MAG: hypothetical protein AAGM40_08470 [Cyanobacteria bacterium J06573_2]